VARRRIGRMARRSIMVLEVYFTSWIQELVRGRAGKYRRDMKGLCIDEKDVMRRLTDCSPVSRFRHASHPDVSG
jgi:hypothetical protein